MNPHHTIVLPEQRAIYFAIPKNACTTVKGLCCRLQGIKINDPLEVHLQEYLHFTTRFWDRVKYRNYFKFAIVRNPWDRLVSCYKSKIDNPTDYHDHWMENGVLKEFLAYGFTAQMPFADFAHQVCDIPDSQADAHFASQFYFVCYKSRILCDFIGRFESLNEDFREIALRLGLAERELAQENATRRNRSYREYYDEELRVRVGERYRVDIEEFRYEF